MSSFETMFDGALPEIADLAGLVIAALVDAAGGWVRAENAACARKLAVMAEIFARRTGLARRGARAVVDRSRGRGGRRDGRRGQRQPGHGIASNPPRGGAARPATEGSAAFWAGLVSDLLVRAIVWRTYLITDQEAMAAVDAALAARITGWGVWSAAKTEAAIDALVDEFDPGALRRSRESASRRTVEFGSPGDVAGTTSMWARLYTSDAVCRGAGRGHGPQRVRRRPAHPARAARRRADRAGRPCRTGLHLRQPDCPGAGGAAPAKKQWSMWSPTRNPSTQPPPTPPIPAPTPTQRPPTTRHPVTPPADHQTPPPTNKYNPPPGRTRYPTPSAHRRHAPRRAAAGLRVRWWDPAHSVVGRHPGAREDPRGPPPRRRHSARAALGTPTRQTCGSSGAGI